MSTERPQGRRGRPIGAWLSAAVLAGAAACGGAPSDRLAPHAGPTLPAGETLPAGSMLPPGPALPPGETLPAGPALPAGEPAEPRPGAAIEDAPAMDALQSSVVQILAQVDSPSGTHTIWHGSGTVVSQDGLILTNAHVANPNLPELAAMQGDPSLLQSPVPDRLVVAVSDTPDRAPVPRYVADVVAADGMLDLAILRIVRTLRGASIQSSGTGLTPVRLGDSDDMHLGDPVQILGFPGIGGETVTLSRGSVAGFLPQALIGVRAWIKTDTAISAGSSGGLAVDGTGRLIGIPTQAALAPGGLHLLRPANLAVPLIDAAREGRPYVSPFRVQGTGAERLELASWADDVDENGCAVRELEAYPAGTTGLAAVFSYRGMSDGELLMADWSHGGQPLSSSVWFWERGPRGTCHPLTFHDFGRALDPGGYRVEVRAGADWRVVGEAATEIMSDGLEAASGVHVEGRVTDAETGAPLPGAVVLVFRPGVSAGAWNRGAERSLDAIFTVGESDRQGRYRLLRPLARGLRYEVAADHPEYIQLLGAFELDASVPAMHTVDIELSR